MQSHSSRVRTPKEMDAYIDRVYDLLAEGEEVAKGRLSVAVPPFTTSLTELTQPAKFAVNALVTLRKETPGGHTMDVAQLEQLQTLRNQQDMLTEQSQAVRKLLQEYDAIDAAQAAANMSAFESFWATPELSGRLGTGNGGAATTQTLKSLCDKQRRTAQVLKAMGSSVSNTHTTTAPLSATADRRLVVTLEDVKETARLPPNSRLIEDMSGRLPSQIKLQALVKEQSKQMAETHAKYRTAHKVVTLWRHWMENASTERRLLHTAKLHHKGRQQREALHRCSWFVALKQHARQCEITVLVNRLDNGWEKFHRRFEDRKHRLALSDKAHHHHIRHAFEQMRSRLKGSRRRAILARAATHVHFRAVWRRFARVMGRKLKLRYGVQQPQGQNMLPVQLADSGTSPARVVQTSAQHPNTLLLFRAIQLLVERCQHAKHSRRLSIVARQHRRRRGWSRFRKAVQTDRISHALAATQSAARSLRAQKLLASALQALQRHSRSAILQRFGRALFAQHWFRKLHTRLTQRRAEQARRHRAVSQLRCRRSWNRFWSAISASSERHNLQYSAALQADQLRWNRACYSMLAKWREFMVHRCQYRAFNSLDAARDWKLRAALAAGKDIVATAGLRAEQAGYSRYRTRSLRDALSRWIGHVQTRMITAVQQHESAQRSDLTQKAKYLANWHSWSSIRRQKEGTEQHATHEFVRWRLSGGFREWMSRTSTMARVREYHHALIEELQGFYLARAMNSWRQSVHERKTARATEEYTCAAMAAYEQKTLLRRLHLCALARRQQIRQSRTAAFHRQLTQWRRVVLALKQTRARKRGQRARQLHGTRYRERRALHKALKTWRSAHRRKAAARRSAKRAHELVRKYHLLTDGWRALQALRRARRKHRAIVDEMCEHHELQLARRGLRQLTQLRDHHGRVAMRVTHGRREILQKRAKVCLAFWHQHAKQLRQYRAARRQLSSSRNRRALLRVWRAIKQWFRQARIDSRKTGLVRLACGRKHVRRHFAKWRLMCAVNQKLKRLKTLYLKAQTHRTWQAIHGVLTEATRSMQQAASLHRRHLLRIGARACASQLPKRRQRQAHLSRAKRGRLQRAVSVLKRRSASRHRVRQAERLSAKQAVAQFSRERWRSALRTWILHWQTKRTLKARLSVASATINDWKKAAALYLLASYCSRQLALHEAFADAREGMQMNTLSSALRQWVSLATGVRWQISLCLSSDPVFAANRLRQVIRAWYQQMQERMHQQHSAVIGCLQYQSAAFKRWPQYVRRKAATREADRRGVEAWTALAKKQAVRRMAQAPTHTQKQTQDAQRAIEHVSRKMLVKSLRWLRACILRRRRASQASAARQHREKAHWWGVWRRALARQRAVKQIAAVIVKVAERVQLATRFCSWKSTYQKLKKLEPFMHNQQTSFLWRSFRKFRRITQSRLHRTHLLQGCATAWRDQQIMKTALRRCKQCADAAVRGRARRTCDAYLMGKAMLQWRLQLILKNTASRRCERAERWRRRQQQAAALRQLWSHCAAKRRQQGSEAKAKLHLAARGQQHLRAKLQHCAIKKEVHRELDEVADFFWSNLRRHRFLFALQLHALRESTKRHYFPQLVSAVHLLRARRVFKEWQQLLPPPRVSEANDWDGQTEAEEDDEDVPLAAEEEEQELLNTSYAHAYSRVAERLDWVSRSVLATRTPIKSC